MAHRIAPTTLRTLSIGAAFAAALGLAACGDDGGGGGDGGGGTDTGVNDTGGGGTDGGGTDGGGTDTGGTVTPPAESLYVVFTREATSDSPTLPQYTQLMVTDESCQFAQPGPGGTCDDDGECEAFEVMPRSESEPLCNYGCMFTPAMDWLVFFDPDETSTLRKAPVGADMQLSGDSEVIATDVRDFSVGDGRIMIRSNNEVVIHDLASGQDTAAGEIQGSGGVYITPDGSRAFIRRVTSLQAMDVVEVPVGGGNETVIHTFEDGGPENAAGSLLRGAEPLAVSPDGTRLAALVSMRYESNICTSNVDCVEEGFQCPVGQQAGRCYQHQLGLNIINLDAADRLGGTCLSDGECGDDHFCDLSAPDRDGNGQCQPSRFVMGPAGQNVCSRISLSEYDDYRPRLSWRGDREVVALLTNSCAGQANGLTVTDVVGVNIDSGIIDRVVENPGLGHGQCYDDVEQCYDIGECVVEISQMAMSPGGSTVGMVADSYTSQNSNELWLVDAFGRDDRIILTKSIDFDVLSVSLYSRAE